MRESLSPSPSNNAYLYVGAYSQMVLPNLSLFRSWGTILDDAYAVTTYYLCFIESIKSLSLFILSSIVYKLQSIALTCFPVVCLCFTCSIVTRTLIHVLVLDTGGRGGRGVNRITHTSWKKSLSLSRVMYPDFQEIPDDGSSFSLGLQRYQMR